MTQKELNQQTLLDAKTLLHEAGILHLVTVSLEDQQMENGKHISVIAGSYESVHGNDVHTETIGLLSHGENIARLFTMFFTQRIDWLKATHSQKLEAMNEGIHPAFFAEEYKVSPEPYVMGSFDEDGDVMEFLNSGGDPLELVVECSAELDNSMYNESI